MDQVFFELGPTAPSETEPSARQVPVDGLFGDGHTRWHSLYYAHEGLSVRLTSRKVSNHSIHMG